MERSAREHLDNYKESLNNLFTDILDWIKERGLTAKETHIEISEPRPGTYSVPLLTIYDEVGTALAEVRPVGAWIIGASWRVDICGHLDKEVLVYWEKGAPELQKSESDEKVLYKTTMPLFPGADKEGWYWIEDKMRGKARLLSKDLFVELLFAVGPL